MLMNFDSLSSLTVLDGQLKYCCVDSLVYPKSNRQPHQYLIFNQFMKVFKDILVMVNLQ